MLSHPFQICLPEFVSFGQRSGSESDFYETL
jgi:hypothetical protein